MKPTDYSYNLTHRESGAEVLTVIDDDGPETITSDHPNYCSVKAAVQEKASGKLVRRLLDVARTVAFKFQELSGRVKVRANTVYFDGEPVDSSVATQIVRVLNEQGDFLPLVRFMENIADNPNTHSRDQLFDWLRSHKFTITAEGEIIGYKGVRGSEVDGFESVNSGSAQVDGVTHNGRIPNKIGCVVSMPRDKVQHAPGVACAPGLHVGTFSYAQSWAQGATLEVAVNPRDVVSVPTDANGEKVRVARYKVLRVITAQETTALYDAANVPVPPLADEDDEDDAYEC